MRRFSSLYPLRKGRESQCQVIKKKKKKLLKYLKSGIVIYIKYVGKKSCHLVLKAVIDLPFEGRKVEGSQKAKDERNFHRREVEGKKPSLLWFSIS